MQSHLDNMQFDRTTALTIWKGQSFWRIMQSRAVCLKRNKDPYISVTKRLSAAAYERIQAFAAHIYKANQAKAVLGTDAH